MTSTWHIRVYCGDSERLRTEWFIKDRDQRAADKEAMAEVERYFPGDDWSITGVPSS